MSEKKIEIHHSDAERDARTLKKQAELIRMSMDYVKGFAIVQLTGEMHRWDDAMSVAFTKEVETCLKGLGKVADGLEGLSTDIERLSKSFK